MVSGLWRATSRVNVNGKIPMVLYKSNRSSLRVAVADTPGPMVKGQISFVTEAHASEGLPHTLEHLVFMGSQRYPYKGVLDVIANRCLASGTNAYTDQDHTAYTITTVGSLGFLKVLPVYMDHLLSPMLTDEQYATEVHHINGEGEDGGVVYSEMQDHEAEMDEIITNKKKDLLYPPNNSYGVNTGGALKDLRTACSNEKVRDFHKQFYHLKNMLVIVCGKIDHEQLLKAIEPVEERELSKVPEKFDRPFQSAVPPLTQEKYARIQCPSDEETEGAVHLAWLGPAASDLYACSALNVLADYLTNTAVAPLQQDFIQLAEPLCSSVDIRVAEQTTCEVDVLFSGVPAAKLEEIKPRFFGKTVTEHAKPEAFDMERMGFVIEQSIKKQLTKMETSPHSQIVQALIGHQLYGDEADDSEELGIRLNEVGTLKRLAEEPAQFWADLVRQIFVKERSVCVVGEPSVEAIQRATAEEEERIDQQREKLGKKGLKERGAKLAAAIKANTEKKPPAEVLKELIVEDLERFNLFDITTSMNLDASAEKSFIHNLPFTTVLHNVPSEFVEMLLVVDTANVPVHLRHFMMLWFELVFESPAVVDGKLLSYEEVSKLATKDLIGYGISTGISGYYDRFVALNLKVSAKDYENLAKWAEVYLKGVVFDPSRAAVSTKKLIGSAAESKRDGYSVAAVSLIGQTFQPEANSHFYNAISLEKFHEQVVKQLESGTEGQADVLAKLEEVRTAFLDCPINVHFACNPDLVEIPDEKNSEIWSFLATKAENGAEKAPIFTCDPAYGSDWGRVGRGRAIALGASESSFLLQKISLDEDWKSDTLMHTLLLVQYMSQCEGPLWNSVRGQGLAYGANIYTLPDRKSMTLNLYRCSNVGQAYKETKDVVTRILESNELEHSLFEAAKRSLVCDLMESHASVKAAARTAILDTVRGLDKNFTLELCAKIWDAKADDVLATARKHLEQLFDETKTVRSVVTHPSKMGEVKQNFPTAEVTQLEKLQIPPMK